MKLLALWAVFSIVALPLPRLRAEEAKAPAAAAPRANGVLADYVQRPDPSFRWTKRREGEVGSAKFVELALTSQTWRDIVWKHQLFLIKPAEVSAKHALLLIDGGSWKAQNDAAPGKDDKLPDSARLLAAAAAQLKAPVVVVRQVPFQPIFGGMVEDEAISYTFEQYFKTNDPTWPLLLPMVKSAVMAMNCAQAFAEQEWQLKIEKFTVTGASKRGWTTWLTGSVDPRVTAIAPMVIDMLNLVPQMKHQVDSFGKFSEQIEDYTRRGLPLVMASPRGQQLLSIVDPYAYRGLLTQPKLILLGTNDRYWPLDALNLYWTGLEGEKRVLYVPNNGHGLNDFERVLGSIMALHRRRISISRF